MARIKPNARKGPRRQIATRLVCKSAPAHNWNDYPQENNSEEEDHSSQELSKSPSIKLCFCVSGVLLWCVFLH